MQFGLIFALLMVFAISQCDCLYNSVKDYAKSVRYNYQHNQYVQDRYNDYNKHQKWLKTLRQDYNPDY